MESTTPPPEVAPPPTPPHPRRLTRSSRDRMWAGVAGGLAEYFELDPALVRLLWVLATVVSGGLAIPVYLVAWIILPRDDRPPVPGSQVMHDWSQELHSEAHRMAEDVRRAAADVRWSHGHAPIEPHRRHRSTGVVLVVLGVLLLAANAGVLRFIDWNLLWPLIFIGLGVALLARQSDWHL